MSNEWRFKAATDMHLRGRQVHTWINIDAPTLGSMQIIHEAGVTYEEASRRTQLAAAAPAMLEALRGSLVWIILATAEQEGRHPRAIENAEADLLAARAAIAAAEEG